MKKKFLVLLTLITVLATSFISVVYADGNITPGFSLIDSTDYVEFSPQKLSVNDDYIVYTENDSLYALSRTDNTKQVLNMDGYTNVVSVAVYKNFAFCVLRDGDNALMRNYDLTTGNHTDSSIVGLSLAVYNDSLFIYYGTGYYVYDLSAIKTINDAPALSQTIYKPYDSSLLFAANSQSIFAINGKSVNFIRLNSEISTFSLPFYPTAASADDDRLYLLTATEIHVYTLTDYTEVCSVSSDESLGTSSSFISLSSDNSKLYASFSSLANGVAVYDVQNDGTLLREKLLTTVGSTLERLNNPVSISADGETVAIADNDNDRVLIPNFSEIKSADVYKVAVNSKCVYFADSEGLKLWTLSDNSLTTLISGITVASLKPFKDGVIYIKNGNVYTYSNSSSSLIAEGNFTDICASFNEKILYLIDNEKTVALHTDAKTTLFTTQLSSVNISGQVMRIECDACGNLIIMTKNDNVYKLIFLKRLLSGYEYIDCATIEGIIPTDFTLSDDGIYFTSNNPHTLTYISFEELKTYGIDCKTEFTSAYTAPDCKSSEPILKEAKIYKITNGNYNSFTYPDDYESVMKAEINALVYCVDNQEYVDNDGNTYLYVMRNGAGEFILKSSLTELSSGVPSVKYGSTLFANTVIYKYPDINSVKLTTLNKGAQIETLSDVCGYDNSAWYSIYVDGGVGYVKRADIVASKRGNDSQTTDPVTPKKYYADVCYDNTMIYAEANESSSIIGILKVGDTVELSAPYDKDELFTFVTFGEISGYVLTSSLKTPGLSTAQIIALVIIFSAAFIIIFLRILSKKATRKKN